MLGGVQITPRGKKYHVEDELRPMFRPVVVPLYPATWPRDHRRHAAVPRGYATPSAMLPRRN
jgi:hypothetical protein